MSNEKLNQLGLIVGTVCGISLTITLLGGTLFWLISWHRQKKSEKRKAYLRLMKQQKLQTGVSFFVNLQSSTIYVINFRTQIELTNFLMNFFVNPTMTRCTEKDVASVLILLVNHPCGLGKKSKTITFIITITTTENLCWIRYSSTKIANENCVSIKHFLNRNL